MTKRITVKEAADLLGVSQQYVRLGMQRGQLPIGGCVKMSSRWTYQISAEMLKEYMQCGNIAARKDDV